MTPRPLAAIGLLLLLIVPAACGGDGDNAPVPPAADPPQQDVSAPVPAGKETAADEMDAGFVEAAEADAAPADATDARLGGVRLLPERLRKDSVPEVKVDIRPAAAPGTSFVVGFWINDRKVQESASTTLSDAKIRKGDGVFADVILLAGDRELDRRRTDLVLVENSDPAIEAVEFPEIKGPGEYVIIIKASDPDGDELTYEIEGVNLPAWLRAEKDGRIRLTPGADPPEVLEFEAVVRDDDGGEARRVLTLKFQAPDQSANEAATEET